MLRPRLLHFLSNLDLSYGENEMKTNLFTLLFVLILASAAFAHPQIVEEAPVIDLEAEVGECKCYVVVQSSCNFSPPANPCSGGICVTTTNEGGGSSPACTSVGQRNYNTGNTFGNKGEIPCDSDNQSGKKGLKKLGTVHCLERKTCSCTAAAAATHATCGTTHHSYPSGGDVDNFELDGDSESCGKPWPNPGDVDDPNVEDLDADTP